MLNILTKLKRSEKVLGIKERKEREKREKRNLILDAANEIITKEGIDKVSIRKIAKMIEYSPPIIYHYFDNKEDIINQLMEKEYQKVIKTLLSAEGISKDPKEKMKESLRRYIYMALEIPDKYKNMLLNDSSSILEHTSVLFKGVAHKNKGIGMLCEGIKELSHSKDDNEIELTAQIIWSATFGLILKMITEKEISKEQKDKLIEYHIHCMTERIINM